MLGYIVAAVGFIISAIKLLFNYLFLNPIVLKMAFFASFVLIIYKSIQYLISFMSPYLQAGGAIISYAAAFGIMDGLAVYFTILVSAWGVKQALSFISS